MRMKSNETTGCMTTMRMHVTSKNETVMIARVFNNMDQHFFQVDILSYALDSLLPFSIIFISSSLNVILLSIAETS